MSYFGDISQTLKTLADGLRVTWPHFKKGHRRRGPLGIEDDRYFDHADDAVTIQYPGESIPVPDNGRYRLHMESEDCIVCDKCARICPVDCIDIESFKAVDDLGFTSDGSKKRLELPVFDIDMAKCCFCGLCTTVCPTECLTMTKVYDFSEYDRSNFTYHFGLLSPEEADAKRIQLAQATPVKTAAPDAGEKKAALPKKPLLKIRKKDE
ncbi:MAG: 4Fe-4S dicluster domain-containing protein [Bacteroidia bacterium]|nr:4Fe-4S dicluster domain-containing protein [Bacteroidia bacterium]